MAKGKTIVLTSPPRGTFVEGIISGTPKPGTAMQIKAATVPVDGEFTWEVAAPSGGDGKPALVAILMEDAEQGKTTTDAYVSGTRGKMYCPIAGEQLNVLVGEAGGTANTLAIGDLLMFDAEDGIFVPNSSGTSVPFQVLEVETQVADSTLVWCLYTGH